MPFAKNWVEELTLEWLLIKGYWALSNVRLGSGKKGGAEEADILGLKLIRKIEESNKSKKELKEILEIVHIETGSLTQNFENNLKNIKSKFTPKRIETIKEMLLHVIELESALGKLVLGYSQLGVSEIKYQPIYIASYVTKKQANKLKEELSKIGIKFLTLEEVLKEIIRDIDEWKRIQVERKLRKTKNITLPEGLWLLNLIDYMKNKNLVNI